MSPGVLERLQRASAKPSVISQLQAASDPTFGQVAQQTASAAVSGLGHGVAALGRFDQRTRGSIPVIGPVLSYIPGKIAEGAEAIAGAIPPVPGQEGELYSEVANMAGTSAALAPAALGGPLALAGAGAAMGMETGIEEAQAAGASPSDTVYASLGNALLGATQAYGPAGALTKFGVKGFGRTVLEHVLTPAAQGFVQSAGTDVVAQQTFDPDRVVDLGRALDTALASGVVGAGTAGIAHKVELLRQAAKVNRPAADVAPTEPSATLTEEPTGAAPSPSAGADPVSPSSEAEPATSNLPEIPDGSTAQPRALSESGGTSEATIPPLAGSETPETASQTPSDPEVSSTAARETSPALPAESRSELTESLSSLSDVDLLARAKLVPMPKRGTSAEFAEIERRGGTSAVSSRVRNAVRAEPVKTQSSPVDEFVSSMAPVQAARARTALDVSLVNSGTLKTRRALVDEKVSNGAKVVMSSAGKRRLQTPDGSYLDESQISKTAMDYAEHIIRAQPYPAPRIVVAEMPKGAQLGTDLTGEPVYSKVERGPVARPGAGVPQPKVTQPGIFDEVGGLFEKQAYGTEETPKTEAMRVFLVEEPGQPAREPTRDELLAHPAVRAELQSMADEAGEEGVGGQLIRGESDNLGSGRGEVIGRTRKNAKAEWWSRRPNNATEAAVKRAVRKALDGKTLSASDQEIIDWMATEAAHRVPPEVFNEAQNERDAIQGEAWATRSRDREVPFDAPDPTSIKNRVVERELSEMGLPAPEGGVSTTFAEQWAKAKETFDADPRSGERLVSDLEATGRPPTKEENALLALEANRLLNERDAAEDAYNAEQTPETVKRREDARESYARTADVLKRAGTESSGSLNFRRMMIARDYSLAALERARIADKGGEPLTNAETAELKKSADRIRELEKQLEEATTQRQKAERDEALKKATDKLKRRGERVKRERQRTVNVQQSRERIKELFGEFARLSKRARTGLDLDALKVLGQIAAEHIKIGFNTFAKFSVEVREHLDESLHRQAWNEGLKVYRAELAEPLEKRLKAGAKLSELTRYVDRIAESFYADGVTDSDKLADAVHSVLKVADPAITREQTVEAISHYGQYRQLSQEEVAKGMRRARGELREAAKLSDVAKGIPPKKTGVEYEEATPKQRRTAKLVREEMKRQGIKTTDPATQIKSALESAKTRARNAIDDLTTAIDTRTQLKKGERVEVSDAELVELKKLRAERQAAYDELFAAPEKTQSERDTERLTKEVAELERRIAAGETAVRHKQGPDIAEVAALKAERARLNDQLAEMRREPKREKQGPKDDPRVRALVERIAEVDRRLAEGDTSVAGKKQGPDRAEIAALKAELADKNAKLAEMRAAEKGTNDDKAVKRLEASLKKLEAELFDIAEGGSADARGAKQGPDTERVAELKRRRADLRSTLADIRDAQNPSMDADVRAIAMHERAAERRLRAEQERMRSGNFERVKEPKVERVKSEKETQTLAELELAKRIVDRGRRANEIRNMTPFHRGRRLVEKYRRAFVLSSPTTLAKLTAAGVERMVFTPTEEAIGGAIGKAIPGVSSQAPREGGVNVRAEARAARDGFMQGLEDAKQTLKTGESELDLLYGKPHNLDPHWTDFLGQLHGALKAPTKRNEFARSFEKRAQWALRNGLDITNQTVQARIAADAYKDANRSIFMQDNRVVDAYKRAIGALEQPNKATGKPSTAGQAAATAARVLLPIVKVPTNVVAETMQYAGGLIPGSLKLAKAYHDGIETLKPEQADEIMRHLKKGSVGGAVLLLGYFGAGSIGGYYQPGKRDEKDVNFGSIRVFGHDIPSLLVHNPLLETLQIGATLRRVSDRKVKGEEQGLDEGAVAAVLGLMEQVPFVRETADIGKLTDPTRRGQAVGQMTADLVVPQAVSWTAKQLDKDKRGEKIRRSPHGIMENIMERIPMLREKLPVKK